MLPSGPQTPARLVWWLPAGEAPPPRVCAGEASGLPCWAHRREPQALPQPQLGAATLVPLTGLKRGAVPSHGQAAPAPKPKPGRPGPCRYGAWGGGVPVVLRALEGTWMGGRISTLGAWAHFAAAAESIARRSPAAGAGRQGLPPASPLHATCGHRPAWTAYTALVPCALGTGLPSDAAPPRGTLGRAHTGGLGQSAKRGRADCWGTAPWPSLVLGLTVAFRGFLRRWPGSGTWPPAPG